MEKHPFEPFLPAKARLLMLGTFPPAEKRWSMSFFYPNFSNDMWRIVGLCFFGDKNHFVDQEHKTYRLPELKAFLQEKGIALYDTACAVRRTRNTASDKDLEVLEYTDIDAMLHQLPLCEHVVTAGQLATDIVAAHFGVAVPRVGEPVSLTVGQRTLTLWRMPSSSRAYPLQVERKAEAYRKVFALLSP